MPRLLPAPAKFLTGIGKGKAGYGGRGRRGDNGEGGRGRERGGKRGRGGLLRGGGPGQIESRLAKSIRNTSEGTPVLWRPSGFFGYRSSPSQYGS
uniref:Uncharacterized protein n=1 Tax=Chromera velia CCMP2878 TaxID=1169474 RepID=A0A0G4GTK2_9ALVE|eukprot:Cvel_23270.t1-p1 / transcript=Cvel_23270.t1 / gene=Cvel_23270 / organism=Chromera_velia_CCMP2878 / gene_product=hypothetical protein / transcript_product=hypothetical protein / location=Cvel_scaffold2379:10298-11412(+) / protein_length=94 / sequence_SO=supercontig / SO=protein_coding / is_pseudo=false